MLEARPTASAPTVVFTSTGGAIYGECDGPAAETAPRLPALPLRNLEARRRGVPRDLEPPLRHAATSRSASATSTGRARIRTARPGSSRSSSSACARARRRRSSATARRPATTSTRATSPAPCSPPRPLQAASSTSAPASRPPCSSCGRAAAARPARRRRAEHAEPRLGELQRSFLDPTPPEPRSAGAPTTSLDDGLRATWEWLRWEGMSRARSNPVAPCLTRSAFRGSTCPFASGGLAAIVLTGVAAVELVLLVAVGGALLVSPRERRRAPPAKHARRLDGEGQRKAKTAPATQRGHAPAAEGRRARPERQRAHRGGRASRRAG